MTREGSGTLTADGTEQTLLTSTKAKLFTGFIDLSNMQSGDITTLRVKTKVLSTGSLQGIYTQRFSGARPSDDVVAVSIPVLSDVSISFSLEQSAGTNRTYPWKVLSA